MTTKNDEQERAEFEAAWASVGPPGADAESLKELRRGNGYANKHPILQGAWQGWKLARAALQSPDREDAVRFRKIINMTRAEREEVLFFPEDKDVIKAIDHAHRVEGDK